MSDAREPILGMASTPDDAVEVQRLRALVAALEKREKRRAVACELSVTERGTISLVVTVPGNRFAEARIAATMAEILMPALIGHDAPEGQS